MQGNFILNDGSICDNSQYGKYGCHLTIIRNGAVEDKIEWQEPDNLIKDMNLPMPSGSTLRYLRGDFFTSKKGTKMFKIKPQGSHVLIQDNWGGAFNSYRGGCLPENGCEYFHRASSNGGGNGYDYAVYKTGFKYTASLEDL